MRAMQYDADSPHLPTESSLLLESFGADRGGRMRAMLLHLLLLAVFGVFLPAKRPDFLDPVITCAYVCLGVVFAGPRGRGHLCEEPSADLRSRDQAGTSVRPLRRMRRLGDADRRLDQYLGKPSFPVPVPELDTLATAGALGLAASFAFALAAAWIALRFLGEGRPIHHAHPATGPARRVLFLFPLAARRRRPRRTGRSGSRGRDARYTEPSLRERMNSAAPDRSRPTPPAPDGAKLPDPQPSKPDKVGLILRVLLLS